MHSLQEVPIFQPTHEKEEAQIVLSQPDYVMRITTDLTPELKDRLTACLIWNNDVFAWALDEVTRAAPTMMEHRLNILLESW